MLVRATTWTYAYRGDGLRDSATTGATTRTFTWDVNAGLPVILDDGAQYIYGAGLVAQVSGSNTYYYLADGLGSTMATTDASGNVVTSYTYDVYGKTTASSGSQANDFQFAGQQTDPTGLQYLRARYYDPEGGGFLSRDPLAAAPAWGGSHYGYSNPAMVTDPTGLSGIIPPVLSGCLFGFGPFCKDSWPGTCNGGPIGSAPCLGPTSDDPESIGAEMFRQLCLGLPMCGAAALWEVRLPTITGEYRSVKATKAGAQMLNAKRWTSEDLDKVFDGVQYRDIHGNDIWLRRHEDGLFDWIVKNEEGWVISARKGEDVNSLRMARDAYPWIPK